MLENVLGLSCFLLSRRQEGEERQQERQQAESGESRLMGYPWCCQGMSNFWWEACSPTSAVLCGGACGKSATCLGADLAMENGKHPLVFHTGVQNQGRSLSHLNILIWGFVGENNWENIRGLIECVWGDGSGFLFSFDQSIFKSRSVTYSVHEFSLPCQLLEMFLLSFTSKSK